MIEDMKYQNDSPSKLKEFVLGLALILELSLSTVGFNFCFVFSSMHSHITYVCYW